MILDPLSNQPFSLSWIKPASMAAPSGVAKRPSNERTDSEPRLRTGWIPSGGDYILDDVAWLNYSQGLLYTVHIQSDRTTMEPDETEFWLLDTNTMKVERIGHYDGMFNFNIDLTPAHKLWSPDGEWIVVTEANNHYLLSIKTGELKPFAEGGYLLGPLELHSATSQ